MTCQIKFFRIYLFSQKKIAKKIESVIDCKRIGVAVIGLEVPHAHVHLVPINEISDMNFQNQRIELNKEDFQNIRDKIIESS
jgi:histidine triad (HIT) family protein